MSTVLPPAMPLGEVLRRELRRTLDGQPARPAGPHDEAAVVPMDEKWRLALAPAPPLAPDGILALEASASRLAASFDARAQHFAFPEDPA